MSGAEDALLDGTGSKSARRDSGATILDGLFYGAIAYFAGYIWVFATIRDDNIKENVAKSAYGERVADLGGSDQKGIDLLVPNVSEYAGWVYQYAMGGSINVSTNLTPGSKALNESILYPFQTPPGLSEDCGNIVPLRETVLGEPWVLLSPSNGHCYVQLSQNLSSVEEMSFVFITPTVLFITGFLIAYRHGELTPLGGAVTGSKVAVGFLAASVASVFLFTVSISGYSFGAEGGVSAELIGLSFSAGVEPVIKIGPNMSRAVIIGVVYPLAFSTLGGIAASGTAVVRLPMRALRSALGRFGG